MTRSRMSFALATVGILFALGCTSAPDTTEGATAADTGGKVAVPDLVGDTMDTVREQLQSTGLVADAATVAGASDWTNEAVAVSTAPAAGAQVVRGSTVKVVAATKAEVVFFAAPMPDLKGMKWVDVASGKTEAAWPYMDATWRKPKGAEKAGTIVGQKPAPGAALRLGQTIRVTVADYEAGEPGSGSSVVVPEVDLPSVCQRTKWC